MSTGRERESQPTFLGMQFVYWLSVLVLPGLPGLALGMMGLTPPAYGLARLFFALGAIWAGVVGMAWLCTQSNPIWVKVGVGFLLGGYVFVGLPLSLGWISGRERPSVQPVSSVLSPQAPAGRRLSDRERAGLRANFGTKSDRIPVVHIICFQDDEAEKYAQDFVDVFARSAILVVQLSGSVSSPDQSGLMIGLTHPDNPSANAKRFIALMKKSGFDLKVITWEGRAAMLQHVPPQYPDADFDLFVGPQP